MNWSRLALDLGYVDQTHLIKDFKALVGRSPAAYERMTHALTDEPGRTGRRARTVRP